MEKREREESEEDQNKRVAKTLLLDPALQNAITQYEGMSPEQRRVLSVGNFDVFNYDLKKLLASVDAGVLMNLAQTARLFADIARQESVWRNMFARDYPRDWEFCRGELPFFVVNNGHPLQDVLNADNIETAHKQPGWKRYYLYTANEYRRIVDDFLKWNARSLIEKNVPSINLARANAREIYRWCQNVPMRMQLKNPNYRETFAYIFVEKFSQNVQPKTDAVDAVSFFWNLHRDGHEWLIAYLAHSGVVNEVALVIAQHFGVAAVNEFKEYIRTHPPWEGGEKELFSSAHKNLLISLLEEKNTLIDNRVSMMSIYNLLADAYPIPCAQTYFFEAISNMAMVRESRKIHELVSFLNESPQYKTKDDKYQAAVSAVCDPFISRSKHYMLIQRFMSLRVLLRRYSDVPRVSRGGPIRYLQHSLCVSCGIQGAEMFHCGGICNQGENGAVYCSTKCQREHWNAGGHSKVCGTK